MLSVGLHCRLIGRPARIGALERFLDHCAAAPEDLGVPPRGHRTPLDCNPSIRRCGVSSLMQPLEAAEASVWLKRYRNLADSRMGAKALSASDDFFADKQRMLQPGEPEWRAGVYDDHGKWMDGWESRRRRDAAHDHCIIQLAVAGKLRLLEIDTRYFTGNYPPFRLGRGRTARSRARCTDGLAAAAAAGGAAWRSAPVLPCRVGGKSARI